MARETGKRPDRSARLKKRGGFTLIEIIFAITLLAIIALGTAQYMVYSRWDIDRGIRKQLAWMNMASRMEQAIDFGTSSLQDSLVETNTSLIINNIQAYRTTIVSAIDDSTDGYYPADGTQPDYYKIQMYISWFTTNNKSDSVTAYLSDDTSWNF
ncbi:MAG: prepilin-type N-terminal cleavage/methylation domain-containing protein [Candidatus Marinimicrobia bacterium]|nr:prepilin-type N-terminal cleavage/methylation domain-containing protein [Candidatus Neomarinimicrobiota bacterium]MCF7904401.1 prepilin-type N-terminal cleavage/methylation domain-containing protein [Candidatus Neomarinimicrobiota bacterium]